MPTNRSEDADRPPAVRVESPDVPVSVAAVPPDAPEEVVAPVRPLVFARGAVTYVRDLFE